MQGETEGDVFGRSAAELEDVATSQGAGLTATTAAERRSKPCSCRACPRGKIAALWCLDFRLQLLELSEKKFLLF